MKELRRYVRVASASEIPLGARKVVQVAGIGQVGVFNVGGSFYALKNVCPHQGGPLCEGTVTGTTAAAFHSGEEPELVWIREGEILRCPWHHWEFEIATGKVLFGPRWRVASYEVSARPAEVNGKRVDAESYTVSQAEDDLFLVLKR